MDTTPYSTYSAPVADRQPPQTINVIVRDIEMSFGSMVVFIIKWVLASIPAMIILFLVGMLLAGVFGGLAGGLLGLGS